MSAVIGFLIGFIVLIVAAVKISQIFSEQIKFFLKGLDMGFKINEIKTLWTTVKTCKIAEPISIFLSVDVLTRCIGEIKSSGDVDGTINYAHTQRLLSKLYDFRTKIEKDADKRRGIESTKALDEGQKFRIILPGKGVFSSELLNNGHQLIIKLPTQKEMITIEGKQWINETISVFLWRKGDARYVFDTKVNGAGVYLGKAALFLEHSNTLVRTQKRNAIRAKCNLNGMLYILKEKVVDYNTIENKDGYRCKIEDISEKGALIRTGGKGLANLRIKIQYQLDNRLIVMFGIIRTVEYNENLNQSRLHFECLHIDPVMKNLVLSYVYNVLPESEKDYFEANKLIDEDEELSPAEKRNLGIELNESAPEEQPNVQIENIGELASIQAEEIEKMTASANVDVDKFAKAKIPEE